MESDVWRGFVAVADTGSFTAASELLPISQSGLSQQIRRLESLLGLELFDRTTRSVALTAAGERLLPLVQDLVRAEDAVLAAVRSERDRDEPETVRLFVAEDAVGSMLLHLVDRLRASAPEIRVEVIQVSIAAQSSSFDRLDVPVALIERTPTPRALGSGRRTALRAEPMCLVVPADFDGPDVMTVADAAGLDLRPMDWLPQAWLDWFPLFSTSPPVDDHTVLVVSSFRAAMQSVPLDRRPCVAPVSIAHTMAGLECKLVELADAPRASLDLVTRTEHPLLDLLHSIAAIVADVDTPDVETSYSDYPIS